MSAGFYLGFIVWGRSPEWPKAPSFLGGSFPHPPMESVRFYVEDDENDIFSILSSARETTSFWWENVKAIVILKRILAKMSLWRKQDVTKFII